MTGRDGGNRWQGGRWRVGGGGRQRHRGAQGEGDAERIIHGEKTDTDTHTQSAPYRGRERGRRGRRERGGRGSNMWQPSHFSCWNSESRPPLTPLPAGASTPCTHPRNTRTLTHIPADTQRHTNPSFTCTVHMHTLRTAPHPHTSWTSPYLAPETTGVRANTPSVHSPSGCLPASRGAGWGTQSWAPLSKPSAHCPGSQLDQWPHCDGC